MTMNIESILIYFATALTSVIVFVNIIPGMVQ